MKLTLYRRRVARLIREFRGDEGREKFGARFGISSTSVLKQELGRQLPRLDLAARYRAAGLDLTDPRLLQRSLEDGPEITLRAP